MLFRCEARIRLWSAYIVFAKTELKSTCVWGRKSAPSAELRPAQKDSDSLPDYSILDKILYQYIERRQGPNEIKAQGFEATLVDKVLKMVNMNEYKRNQFCPIIRISPKAFGVGRRLPIVAKYLS